MTGTGGGTLTTPILSAYEVPLAKAIALASATGLVTGTVATIGAIITGWHAQNLPSYSLGYVDFAIFIVMLPTVMISAPWGVRVGHKMSEKMLQLTYAALLILIGLNLLRRLVFGERPDCRQRPPGTPRPSERQARGCRPDVRRRGAADPSPATRCTGVGD